MNKLLKAIGRRIGFYKNSEIQHGIEGINSVGHRKYVGGMWDEIGKLQFDFLVSNGLRKEDVFLDIACGSLRAGRFLIPYLNQGNYLGIDKEKELIDLGLEHEIDTQIVQSKKPEFIISDSFEFQKFSKKADKAIAQSLFTHLPPNLINLCLKNLAFGMKSGGVLFATFFISLREIDNPLEPNDHSNFKYTYDQIKSFGESNGLLVEHIGEWSHPRNQQMVKFTLM